MGEDICITNGDNGELKKRKLKRNNYFTGKVLDLDDFNAEQRYLIQKIRRLGAHVFGCGVIEGLKVKSVQPKKRSITLAPGSAVDGSGNLLVVLKERRFHLEREIVPGDYIYLRYKEEGTDKIPRVEEEECSDDCCFDRVEEDVEIFLDKKLYDSTVAKICDGEKRAAGFNSPMVLLGRFQKGGIDYTDVSSLHKNSELSQLLCEIFSSYVRSLNGRTGDLSAVSSIEDAKPDDNGHITLEAGNNIRIESEESSIKISSKSGLYASYIKRIEANESTIIAHGLRSYPSVDIYKRVRAYVDNSKKKYELEAMTRAEFYKMAKDMMVDPETLAEELEAKEFSTYMEDYNEKMKSLKRKSISDKSRISTAFALRMYEIRDLSSKLHRAADVEIGKLRDDIYVLPKYYLEKVVGGVEDDLKVKIIHLDNNSVKIENLTQKALSLTVILNA